MSSPAAKPAPAPDRIFSGMQPTGELHLGNYLGALANWVEMSRATEALFCIVDQHALTVDYDPKDMPARVFEFAVAWLAAGIDPERSIVFVQSHVPEHTELAWYLSTVTQFGELGRMTQFKDKSDQHRDNVNAALFTYPVLMAADILLYKATLVPVGDDQVQHLELARDVAHRFNTRFGPTFPLPRPRLSSAPRIMGVDGVRKMSKSLGNTIGLFVDEKALTDRLRPAFTDPQRLRRTDPGRPEICNIHRMHGALATPEETDAIAAACRDASLGCGDCKKQLVARLAPRLAPMRDRAEQLRARPDEVHQILREGARRARAIAHETLSEVRERLGLLKPA